MWIEELPNGKYKYIERYKDPYSEKTKKVSITLNSKSNQAKKQAQKELIEKIEKRLHEVDINKITFAELVLEWQSYFPNTVKARTYSNYKYPLKIIQSYFDSDFLIHNISRLQIKKFINELYYDENYSLNYVKMIKNALSSIFEYAIHMEYILENPAKNIVIKKKPDQAKDTNQISEKYLERDELVQIIKYQKNSLYGARNSKLTEFIALTGLRFGEAVALKYDDFDGLSVDVRGTIDYVSFKSSSAHITSPKTSKSTRRVELSDRAIEIVTEFINENELKKLNSNYKEKGFIFTTSTGNPIIISNFNNSLKKASRSVGINKHVTSHILRHTHISLLSELGVPIKAIMDRVGHEEAETTLKIYTHVTDNMKQDVINKLNSIRPFSAPF